MCEPVCFCDECEKTIAITAERERIKEIIRQQLWLKDVITLGQWTALEEAIDKEPR